MLGEFMLDLIWDMGKASQTVSDLIMKSLTELLKVNILKLETLINYSHPINDSLKKTCDELRLFDPIDDQNNNNLFKNYLKGFVQKTFIYEFKYPIFF